MKKIRKFPKMVIILAIIVILGAVYYLYTTYSSSLNREVEQNNAIEVEPPKEISDWDKSGRDYQNKEYGFSLTFSEEWKGYKITNQNFQDEAQANMRLWVPYEKAGTSVIPGYQEIMIIRVFKKESWNSANKKYNYLKVAGETGQYVVAYEIGAGIAHDSEKYKKLAEELIKTFKPISGN